MEKFHRHLLILSGYYTLCYIRRTVFFLVPPSCYFSDTNYTCAFVISRAIHQDVTITKLEKISQIKCMSTLIWVTE